MPCRLMQKRLYSCPHTHALLKYPLTLQTDVYLRGEKIADARTPEIYHFNSAPLRFELRTGF